jgi:catechol 2,3-dioxygenase-like lactoylglutathione lyase family enzyme
VTRWFLSFAVLLLAIPLALLSRHAVNRPAIAGVAHIALKTNDLAAERAFYGKGCGFAELSAGRFKVNDRQYIEILPTLGSETEDRLDHIAFETSNLQAMRDYLASQNVAVPAAVKKDADGNLSLMLNDPDNHHVEFVQYLKGSVQKRAFGKMLAETRVSERMIHVGVTVRDRAAADRFYKDILGFKMTWYGGPTDDSVKWIDMRVPEGPDWLEYMLVSTSLTPKQLGVLHHLALGVPDIQAGFKTVTGRGITPPQPPKIGRDGKWQLNLYDANLTRTELMEPKPVQTPCCSPFVNQ